MPYAWRPDAESAWIEIVRDVVLPGFGDADGDGVRDDITFPAGSEHFAGWTEEDRAAAGVVEIAETDAPTGLSVKSAEPALTDVEGVPTRVWTVTERTPEEVKSLLCAYARQKRWECEQGGLLFDGFGLPTNDAGQAYIKGAAQAAALTPGETKKWQVGNDPIQFTTFTDVQQIALGKALNSLVQATFDTLADVGDAIAAGEITTKAEVDAAFAAVSRVFISEA